MDWAVMTVVEDWSHCSRYFVFLFPIRSSIMSSSSPQPKRRYQAKTASVVHSLSYPLSMWP